MKNLLAGFHKGIDLAQFLDTFGDQLKHKRIFYIVEPNLEKGKVIKFGIGGMNTGNGYSRLKEYEIIYGKKDRKNSCLGVRIWYVGITEYNRLVEETNTQIYKIEKALKKHFKSKTEPYRGTERLANVRPSEVIEKIHSLHKTIKDVETKITRHTRPSTQRYRTDKRAYIK